MSPTGRRLSRRELADVVADMPKVEKLAAKEIGQVALYLTVLGFEDRALAATAALAGAGMQALCTAVISYETNETDNDRNWTPLKEGLDRLCSESPAELRAGPSLAHNLRELVDSLSPAAPILFDISVASNDVIIEALGALLESDVEICLVYAEADEYRPTREEFEDESDRFIGDSEMGLDHGVLDVVVAGEGNGAPSPNLPDHLVLFPGFSRDRVRSIISQIDSGWIVAPESASITWAVGIPPHGDLSWRRDALYRIHELDRDPPPSAHDVSTFDYRETLRTLDDIYRDPDVEANLAIAALGSKLQAVGIVLFTRSRPDVSVYLARPQIYNAGSYTRGVRNLWQLRLGSASRLVRDLRSVGHLSIHDDPSCGSSAETG